MSIFPHSHQLASVFSVMVAHLTEPSPAIEDPEQRRNARLSSALLLTSVAAFVFSLVVMNVIDERLNWHIPEVIAVLCICVLSRTRHFQLAAVLAVSVFCMPSFRAVVLLDDFGPFTVFYTLVWLTIPVIYASLVLDMRATFATAALIMTGIFALTVLINGMDFLSIGGSIAYVGSVAGLIVIATVIRQRYSTEIKQHLTHLGQAKAALQQANDELEKRVEARTLELQQANERLSHEVSERKLAQQEALEALRLKSQILANVSHDARTPLSVIMLRTELMKRGTYGPLTAQQQDILNRMLLNSKDLLDFIDNLLQESRLNSPQEFTPNKSEIVLPQWLDEFVSTVRPLAEQKQLQLAVEVAEDVPPVVFSDPCWLRHVLNNLVSNAVKFTEEGAITIRVFGSSSDYWGMSVQDTGRGIPAEAQEHIFKAFWQVDGSTTRTTSRGVGLGLSIVNNLVCLLGGQVKVESVPGAGSTFTIILPLEEEPSPHMVND